MEIPQDVQNQPQPKRMNLNILPPPLQALMFGAMGESMILLGAIFALVGFASFIGSVIGIKGSGEIILGIVLLAFGFFFVSRSKLVIKTITPNPQPPQTIPIKQDPPSGYR